MIANLTGSKILTAQDTWVFLNFRITGHATLHEEFALFLYSQLFELREYRIFSNSELDPGHWQRQH